MVSWLQPKWVGLSDPGPFRLDLISIPNRAKPVFPSLREWKSAFGFMTTVYLFLFQLPSHRRTRNLICQINIQQLPGTPCNSFLKGPKSLEHWREHCQELNNQIFRKMRQKSRVQIWFKFVDTLTLSIHDVQRSEGNILTPYKRISYIRARSSTSHLWGVRSAVWTQHLLPKIIRCVPDAHHAMNLASIQSLHKSLDSFYHLHYKCYGSQSSRGTSLVKKAVHVWFCPYRPMGNPWVSRSINYDLFCTRLHEVNELLFSQLVLCLWWQKNIRGEIGKRILKAML